MTPLPTPNGSEPSLACSTSRAMVRLDAASRAATKDVEGKKVWQDVPFTDPLGGGRYCARMAPTRSVFFVAVCSRRDAASGGQRRVAELRLDIGVGTGPRKYRTLQEATAALIRFGKVFLPPTMVLLSGGGLHVY